jgi:hypothetical protein
MTAVETLGHITIRVPVEHHVDYADFSNPSDEHYIEYGASALVEHDLSDHNLGWLGDEKLNGDVMANFEMPDIGALVKAADEREAGKHGPVDTNLFPRFSA